MKNITPNPNRVFLPVPRVRRVPTTRWSAWQDGPPTTPSRHLLPNFQARHRSHPADLDMYTIPLMLKYRHNGNLVLCVIINNRNVPSISFYIISLFMIFCPLQHTLLLAWDDSSRSPSTSDSHQLWTSVLHLECNHVDAPRCCGGWPFLSHSDSWKIHTHCRSLPQTERGQSLKRDSMPISVLRIYWYLLYQLLLFVMTLEFLTVNSWDQNKWSPKKMVAPNNHPRMWSVHLVCAKGKKLLPRPPKICHGPREGHVGFIPLTIQPLLGLEYYLEDQGFKHLFNCVSKFKLFKKQLVSCKNRQVLEDLGVLIPLVERSSVVGTVILTSGKLQLRRYQLPTNHYLPFGIAFSRLLILKP